MAALLGAVLQDLPVEPIRIPEPEVEGTQSADLQHITLGEGVPESLVNSLNGLGMQKETEGYTNCTCIGCTPLCITCTPTCSGCNTCKCSVR